MTNRNLNLIKELDVRVEELQESIRENPKMDQEQRKKMILEIFNLSNEKVNFLFKIYFPAFFGIGKKRTDYGLWFRIYIEFLFLII